ncbi:MAG: hypothetical protein JRI22_21115 [Deltaproteobacteria bacterium]|nr:hypothetical protein [Deltaproteobacteria bacterium]
MLVQIRGGKAIERLCLRIVFISFIVVIVSLYFNPLCLASRAKESIILGLNEEGCTAFGVTGGGTYDGFALIGGTSDNKWMMRALPQYISIFFT